MKIRLALLLCACSSAYAEPVPLPPVVDNSAYPAAKVNPAKPPSTNTLFEIMGRLEQLQQDVQQLTGKVEEQTYQLNELKKRQNTMYTDFDDRIQSIDTKVESVKQAASAAPADAAPASSEAKPAETTPPADVAPAPVAAAAPEAAAAPSQPVAAEKPAPAAGDEKQQYQHAYDELRNGHTSQAITEFNTFLTEHPNGELAGNAQYWLGEAYKVNQEIDAAKTAFKKVVDNYPTSAKVPDALLKLGYIEMDQKNSSKARELLTRVTTEFSSSTAAHLAAKKLLLLDEVKN
ncbi:MAG: tol-pal system protein YbgF [Methylococcales bacterium]